MSVGGRWTEDEKDWCLEGRADVGFISVPTAGQLCASETWSDFSPRLVGEYKVHDDLMLYASVSQGYKAGGFNPAAADF